MSGEQFDAGAGMAGCEACAELDGAYCSDVCADRAAADWAYLKGTSDPSGELTEAQKQELRDAGRGHLVKP